eukprot:349807_1
MASTFSFNTNHKDLIHDVSFDYYGTMIATCSSDQTIKIWKYNSNVSDWTCIQQINHIDHTHKAAIQMICWANPIFGSIFASCSTDKKINIFALRDSSHNNFSNGSMYNFSHRKKEQFSFKRVFIEFHDAESISFVPKNLGLKLSIVCNKGKIKILTCRDITNLSQWTQESSIDISYSNIYNISKFSNRNNNNNNYTHIHLKKSKSYNMDLETAQYKRMNSECIKSYCISWNKSTWELPSFAVGTNRNQIFIYKYFDKNILLNKNNNNNNNEQKLMETANVQRAMTNLNTIKKNIDWHCVCKIQIENKDKNNKNKNDINVRSISWSRHLAKKYHLLAIGSSDGYVRIIKIIRNIRIIKQNNIKNDINKIQWNIIFESNIHKDSVWKVKWNITGNVLLSAGDDAKIYLWKRHQLNVDTKYIPTCISNPFYD